ncbi:capsular biosynthesis protein [Clostridium sp. HMb25]|nr:capsular biosynthesis protein [Clostridium sp. HMb25]
MKVLVTGADGFIGKNLCARLAYEENIEVLPFDKDMKEGKLEEYSRICEFVLHLAGVNRPKDPKEFQEGNFGFTSRLLSYLKQNENDCPIMLASSTQAELNNPYGKSKLAGEKLLRQYGGETGAKILIYRFTNVFGKWCLPNYNSAVATFCYNTANDLPLTVNGRETKVKLIYIDDVVDELISALNGRENKNNTGFCQVHPDYTVTLGEIVDLLQEFKNSRESKIVPDMTNESFSKKLYSTYLSYLPEQEFKYPLKMNIDERGSFTEILRTADRGQFSVNISKPGIEKGNHWHNTKNEKFVVVSGKALIQFRRPESKEIINYHVSGEKLEIVDIPVGYTHNIINEGDTDLVTFMWCNECFDPERPDTFFLRVNDSIDY